MLTSAERQRRRRERRRESGTKPYEVWLDTQGHALLEEVRQPGEPLGTLVTRVLTALKRVTSNGAAANHGAVTSDAVLLALIRLLFPEDTSIFPRQRYGLTRFPLYQVNTWLAAHGYVLHAAKTRDAKHFVQCLGKDGRTEPFGLFELRRV